MVILKKSIEEIKKLDHDEKVNYYSTYKNDISVNNGNTKTGPGCLTLSVPTEACGKNVPCKKGCYCLKGRQQFAQILGGYHRNLRLWNESHKSFKLQLTSVLDKAPQKKFRWFDAGDIPDADFLDMMFVVARKYPEISFLSYTKKYDMVNEYLNHHRLPKNLCIRFSMWDKTWDVPNPHNLPLSYVNFKDTTRNPDIPKKAFKCPGTGKTTCDKCGVCFNKNVKNVVFNQH